MEKCNRCEEPLEKNKKSYNHTFMAKCIAQSVFVEKNKNGSLENQNIK